MEKTPGAESANVISDPVSNNVVYWYDPNTMPYPVVANSAQHTIREAHNTIQDLLEANKELYRSAFMWKWWFYATWGVTLFVMIVIFLAR